MSCFGPPSRFDQISQADQNISKLKILDLIHRVLRNLYLVLFCDLKFIWSIKNNFELILLEKIFDEGIS